jgi:hypothetical protein
MGETSSIAIASRWYQAVLDGALRSQRFLHSEKGSKDPKKEKANPSIWWLAFFPDI